MVINPVSVLQRKVTSSQIILCCVHLFEMGPCYVSQADLELLGSTDPLCWTHGLLSPSMDAGWVFTVAGLILAARLQNLTATHPPLLSARSPLSLHLKSPFQQLLPVLSLSFLQEPSNEEPISKADVIHPLRQILCITCPGVPVVIIRFSNKETVMCIKNCSYNFYREKRNDLPQLNKK